jgi:hypothetical protein
MKIERETTVKMADHEVLIVFDSKADAMRFEAWLHYIGQKQFDDWDEPLLKLKRV